MIQPYFFSSANLTELRNNIESDLKSVIAWLSANKLLFNATKTNFIIYKRNKTTSGFQSISAGDKYNVERVSSCKYLGIYIDEKLCWNDQVDNICKRSSTALGQLHRYGYMILFDFRNTLYESLFLSIIKYCLPIWGATSATNINRINKIINRGIRGIFVYMVNFHMVQI